TANTFDPARIHRDDDWIRREVALALALKKPIVPAAYQGQSIPPLDELPPNLNGIERKHCIFFNPLQFDASVAELARHCVNISNCGLRLRQPTPQPIPQPSLSIQGDNNAVHNGTGDLVTGSGRKYEITNSSPVFIEQANITEDTPARLNLKRQQEIQLQQQ